MKMNERAGKRINIYSSILWLGSAVVLMIMFLLVYELSDIFSQLVLALSITIALINLAGILPLFYKKRNLDIINWGIFQSALLILTAFSMRFPAADRKAFWLGIGAICLLYATTRLSSAWLFKKFNDIEKL